MPYASSGDAKIYYEVHGAGPGVLFVHGSGGHHVAWWQQVAALSGSHTVITVDLRGFGNSRWESNHDARNFSGDIIAVLDAVAASGGRLAWSSSGSPSGRRPRYGPRSTGRTAPPG